MLRIVVILPTSQGFIFDGVTKYHRKEPCDTYGNDRPAKAERRHHRLYGKDQDQARGQDSPRRDRDVRPPAAAAWIAKHEEALAKPGALDKAKIAQNDPILPDVIDTYVAESEREIGRTKAQVLKAIKKFPLVEMLCSTIKSKDIIESLQSLTTQPQTVGNDASHLAAIFAIARPMWDYRLDDR